MRVLVIGGTGFVGPVIVARLTAQGHAVTVVHRGRTEARLPAAVRHVRLPALGEAGRPFLAGEAGALRRLAPDVVLHMIPRDDRDVRAVQEVFRGVARRVVGISSSDVYRAYDRLHRREPGPPDPVPLSEDAPLRERFYPDGPGAEKILAERALLDDPALPGTVLRWPAVYGPGDYLHRLWAYLRRMDAGRPAIPLEAGLARWRWTRGYRENVAHAVVLAVTDGRATGRVYNVGEADALPEAEWVRAIGRAAGWTGEVAVVPPARVPDWLRSPMDTAQHWVTDTARLRAELGYREPVPRDEALRHTVAWQRADPPPSGRFPDEEALRARFADEDGLLAALEVGT